MNVNTTGRRGYTLVDALILLILLTVVGAVLLGTGSRSRRGARLAHDKASLMLMGAATGMYAGDFADAIEGHGAWPYAFVIKLNDAPSEA